MEIGGGGGGGPVQRNPNAARVSEGARWVRVIWIGDFQFRLLGGSLAATPRPAIASYEGSGFQTEEYMYVEGFGV